MMYLDEDMPWAQATGEAACERTKIKLYRDGNGVVLEHGDSVVLIKKT
jgi:protein PhnA